MAKDKTWTSSLVTPSKKMPAIDPRNLGSGLN